MSRFIRLHDAYANSIEIDPDDIARRRSTPIEDSAGPTIIQLKSGRVIKVKQTLAEINDLEGRHE